MQNSPDRGLGVLDNFTLVANLNDACVHKDLSVADRRVNARSVGRVDELGDGIVQRLSGGAGEVDEDEICRGSGLDSPGAFAKHF